MLTIDIEPGIKDIERALGPKMQKQTRYAMKGALDNVAYGVQKLLREGLPGHFIVRSTWVERGIQVDRASKSNLVATVGSVSHFMEWQAYGGDKEGQGGGDVAVPVGARKTPQHRTTRAQWPARILARKRAFIVQTKRGDTIIARRTMKARYPIIVMYRLRPEVKIKPRWPFESDVTREVASAWPDAARRAVEHAIKTALPKAR